MERKPIPYWLLILIGSLLFIGFGAIMAWVTWARPAMVEKSWDKTWKELVDQDKGIIGTASYGWGASFGNDKRGYGIIEYSEPSESKDSIDDGSSKAEWEAMSYGNSDSDDEDGVSRRTGALFPFMF